MSDHESNTKDDRLTSIPIPDNDEAPKVYAVSDLRAYVKPDLDEELGTPSGEPAVCGTEVICSCVPVETCACNIVTYATGDSACTADCSCEGVCVALYWYPT